MCYLWDIETVPTLLRIEAGVETERIVGWDREQWRSFTGATATSAPTSPTGGPGCGSLSVDPTRADELRARFSASGLRSRRVDFAALEDEFEAMYDRGWSDGLPARPAHRGPRRRACSRAPTAHPTTSSPSSRPTSSSAPSRRWRSTR